MSKARQAKTEHMEMKISQHIFGRFDEKRNMHVMSRAVDS